MRLVLPKLYVILDAALVGTLETDCARQLADAGVRLVQYRNKKAPARELLRVSLELARLLLPLGATFIVNDRPDVACLSGASGVHVGQEDLEVEPARAVAGPGKWVGVSTHNLGQFRAAAETSADYIAVGPIFQTTTKTNADPMVGIEFIRQVRTLTDKAIVAIGGITLERAAGVIEAGANAVAVGSDILCAADRGKRARQYIEILEAANHAAAV